LSVTGNWKVSLDSDNLDGYVVLNDVRAQFTIALVDLGNGQLAFGPVLRTSISRSGANVNIDFHNPIVNVAASFMSGTVLQQFLSQFDDAITRAVGLALAAMPPFTL